MSCAALWIWEIFNERTTNGLNKRLRTVERCETIAGRKHCCWQFGFC